MRTSPLSLSLFILAVVVTTGTFVAGSDSFVVRTDSPTKVNVARKANLTTGTVLGESAFASETKIFNIKQAHFSKQPNGFSIVPVEEHFLMGEVSPITKKLIGSRGVSVLMYDPSLVSEGKTIQVYSYNALSDRWIKIPASVDVAAGSVIVFHKPGRSYISLVEVSEPQTSHFSFGIHRILKKAVFEAQAQGLTDSLSI